jgi:hybrid cluster-associated redox disulfide protein
LRLSKEENWVFQYLSGMETKVQIESHWTVDETLRKKLEASRVFIRNQMQCVGCYMQKFCTLKDVSGIYQKDLDEFLKDLNEYDTANGKISKKEK